MISNPTDLPAPSEYDKLRADITELRHLIAVLTGLTVVLFLVALVGLPGRQARLAAVSRDPGVRATLDSVIRAQAQLNDSLCWHLAVVRAQVTRRLMILERLAGVPLERTPSEVLTAMLPLKGEVGCHDSTTAKP